MDCPTKHVKEIITLLLIAGSDQSLKSNSGKTAEEIARENNNEEALAGFFEYEEASDKTEIMSKFQDIAKDLHENYCYQDPSAYMTDVQPWDAKFHVPSFLFERQRAGLIPQGMKIHEHQIRPLIKEAVDEMAGPDALACLDFTRKQANMNKVRREILIQQSQPTWTPPILPKI